MNPEHPNIASRPAIEPTARELFALFLCFSGLAAWTLPLFESWAGQIDFRHTTVLPAAAQQTILEFGQWPLWNPYTRGGFSLIGAVESGFLFPTFPLVLLFDVFIAVLIEYVLFAAVGALGLYLLSLRLGIRRSAALLPPLVLLGSNTLPIYLVGGWFMHFTMVLIPLALWLWFSAEETAESAPERSRRYDVGLAVLLLLFFLRGGMYPLCYLVVILGVLALGRAAWQRRLRPVWRLSRIGVLALLLSGVKLLPVLMVGDPGMWRGAEGFCFTPAGLATGLTSWVIPGSQFEGCGYVGAGVLGLGVLGFVLHARRFAGLLFCTILLAAYALGTHLLPGAWQGPTGMHECPPGFSFSRLVRELPFFDALWNPSRALVPVGLLLSVAAAGALDSLAEATAQRFGGREPGRLRVALCLSLTLAVCVPAYAQVSAYLGHTMTPLDLGEPPAERSPFRQHAECATPDDRAAVRKSDVFCPRLNRGSRLSNLAFHPTAPGLRVVEDPAYLGEQYWLPEAGGAGQVTRTDWTPNHMTYHVEGTGSGWLVINQNYRRGWTVDGLDTSVVSIQGLMAVQLSAPATVTLRYQPSAFSYGLAVTLLGWILLVLWWRAGPRRRGGRPRTLPV